MSGKDFKQWLYRYIQTYVGWFASPEWHVAGDEHIPRLYTDLERLADHINALADDDDRFRRVAAAIDARGWTTEDLSYKSLISGTINLTPPIDDVDHYFSDYVENEIEQIRLHRDS